MSAQTYQFTEMLHELVDLNAVSPTQAFFFEAAVINGLTAKQMPTPLAAILDLLVLRGIPPQLESSEATSPLPRAGLRN